MSTPAKDRRPSRRIAMGLAVGMASGALAAVAVGASAAIPDTQTNLITGCRDVPTGKFRVIDAQAGQGCRRGEQVIRWSSTTSIGQRGPRGFQGPKGATGAQGVRGATGAKGDTGVKGDAGPRGLPGPTGSPGAKGDTGQTGATGPQGPQGAPGLRGPGLVVRDAAGIEVTDISPLDPGGSQQNDYPIFSRLVDGQIWRVGASGRSWPVLRTAALYSDASCTSVVLNADHIELVPYRNIAIGVYDANTTEYTLKAFLKPVGDSLQGPLYWKRDGINPCEYRGDGAYFLSSPLTRPASLSMPLTMTAN